jgi:zinc/manganese transport system substrate-binding protein
MRRGAATMGAIVFLALLASLGASGGPARASAASGPITVVAAENTWGSLAAQLGGRRVDVLSVVSDPNADPHEYETNPANARAVADARYVIVNGAGYDSWATELLAAQAEPARRVLDVATLLGRRDGDNPHFWYSPAFVGRVMERITADYERLDPADRGYFERRQAVVEAAFSGERQRIAALRARFAGRPVAATESIVEYLAAALDLRLVTPGAFMDAVAEGNDPPAQAEATFYRQIAERSFGVLVYNVQTATPLTTSLRRAAASAGIAVVGVSETIQPPDESFEAWMDGQLDRLAHALGAGSPAP